VSDGKSLPPTAVGLSILAAAALVVPPAIAVVRALVTLDSAALRRRLTIVTFAQHAAR
jgi:hypothetical protein